MGAYLYFKTIEKEDAVITAIAEYLYKECPINQTLMDIEENIYLYSNEDILWAQEHRPDMIEYCQIFNGKGSIKTSGGLSCEAERKGFSEAMVLELQTQVFERLNRKFPGLMRYYARSCSLTVEECYFSIYQMKRITEDGNLLSGKSKVLKKYNALKKVLAADVVSHDNISALAS